MTAVDDLVDRYAEACRRDNAGLRARLGGELDAADNADRARLEAPDALRKAAHWYAARGIAVFPLHPRDKRPATRNGFKDASTDRDRIAAWWAATPDANIGTPTGHTFDVVDVDGPEGVTAYMADDAWRDGLIGHATTGRPGGHHLYYPPTGQPNGAGITTGVDYRGLGGYVALPPSIHPTGRRYKWLRPLATS